MISSKFEEGNSFKNKFKWQIKRNRRVKIDMK